MFEELVRELKQLSLPWTFPPASHVVDNVLKLSGFADIQEDIVKVIKRLRKVARARNLIPRCQGNFAASSKCRAHRQHLVPRADGDSDTHRAAKAHREGGHEPDRGRGRVQEDEKEEEVYDDEDKDEQEATVVEVNRGAGMVKERGAGNTVKGGVIDMA